MIFRMFGEADIVYYIAQLAGIMVGIGAIVSMQLKEKKHILPIHILMNTCGAINILLLDKFGTGVVINLVAIVQVILSMKHERNNTEPSKKELAAFFVAYVGCGLISFHGWLDILPIIAVLFYLFAVFQKTPQRLRCFMLGNGVSWIIYHSIIGSTVIFAQIASITSALVGLYRYRNQNK